MQQLQVKISPAFFANIKRDYSLWSRALVREFIQNSIDCGSDTITITITQEDEYVRMIVENNGEPMTEDTLLNKLLALGGSGKEFQGTVGGFGVAKSLLYMCHREYTIETGTLKVEGSGGDYTLERNRPLLHGTRSTILIEGETADELLQKCRAYIYRTQWHGTFLVNGESLKGAYRKGTKRRELTWATIYTNKGLTNRLLVRINGIPMFERWVNAGERCVLVELKGSSGDILQANRDGLKYQYQAQLDSFIDELTTDRKKALKNDQIAYWHYQGDKLKADKANELTDIINEAYTTLPTPTETTEETIDPITGVPTTAARATPDEQPLHNTHNEARCAQINHDFIIRNATGMEIPEHYLPSSFSSYSKKLLKCWVQALLKLHRLFDSQENFSVGFVFDEYEALYETSPEYGRVFYINPVAIVTQKNSQSRSMAKRWAFTPSGKMQLLATALHELVHGTSNDRGHGEQYANDLTTAAGVLLYKIKEFHECFR